MVKAQTKIIIVLFTVLTGISVNSQVPPQPNGYTLGENQPTESVSATQTTTNTAPTQATTTGRAPAGTAPTEITTLDPMDPARDAKSGSDATRDNRAMAPAPVSGTIIPDSSPSPRY